MKEQTFRIKEAANYIGIGEATLKRYLKKNLISATTKSNPGSKPVLVFSKSELDRFKEYYHQSKTKPAIELSSPVIPTETIPVKPDNLTDLISMFGDYYLLDKKLVLSLNEASTISGLSKNYLAKAIRSGKLKATKIAGWKISRHALNQFIESEFK